MNLSLIANQVRRLRADERGAVSVIMGVLMIPLVGALAIGFEVSNWYLTARAPARSGQQSPAQQFVVVFF